MDTDTSKQKLTKKERKEQKKKEKLEKELKQEKSKQTKKYINWGIGIALLVGFVFFIKTAFTPPSSETTSEIVSTNASDQIKGASESAALLIEYSDFQCPACKQYYPVVQQLVEDKADEFTFVYRHFPLPQHGNAEPAARAAEAAGKQGKFWEMHDLIFERQESWTDENNIDEVMLSYAEELELDLDEFESDYNSQEVKDKVSNDRDSGNRADVSGTPTFYLNGEKIRPGSYDDFVDLIDEANAS